MNTKGLNQNIKVFIPVEKRKYNKKILSRGFWQSESGKVENDYIEVRTYGQSIKGLVYQDSFYRYLDNLKQIKTNGKAQECIFYKIDNIGYVYYSRDKIQILPYRLTKTIAKNNIKELKGYIKKYLKEFNGLTIYQDKFTYLIEVFDTI